MSEVKGNLLRMRTIEEAAAYIQEVDPGTAVTKTALRRLVTTGQIPSARVGNKRLVALEAIYDYLSGKLSPAPPQSANQYGKVRPVDLASYREV